MLDGIPEIPPSGSRLFDFLLIKCEGDPDLSQPLTIITLKRTYYPQSPLILVAAEVGELRRLLDNWDEHSGGMGLRRAPANRKEIREEAFEDAF